MISLKRKEKGFTIVELLIVIVVIGILAAIVIVTFTGVQKKARDSERTTDVNNVYSQLEVFFADKTYYPTLAQLATSQAGRDTIGLGSIKNDILTPPGATAVAVVASGTATNNYQYVVTPSGCDNTGSNLCTGYVLTSTLEAGGTFVKNGSNN